MNLNNKTYHKLLIYKNVINWVDLDFSFTCFYINVFV